MHRSRFKRWLKIESDGVDNDLNMKFGVNDTEFCLLWHEKIAETPAAIVRRASINGLSIAAKSIRIDNFEAEETFDLKCLIRCIEQLNHTNICRYIGHDFRSNKVLHQFMELLPASLVDQLDAQRNGDALRWQPMQVSNVLLQIAKALRYLHSKSIIHRDIKGENVRFSETYNAVGDCIDTTYKLSDFNDAVMITDGVALASNVGTPAFMAPEMVALDGLKYALYDTKVDCWSFGMLMYEVIALKLPHDDIDGFALPQHVVNGNKPAFPTSVSSRMIDAFQDLYDGATVLSPVDRFSAKRIVEELIKINDAVQWYDLM